MLRTCNKCRGKKSYRTTPDGLRLPCSRCRGMGLMDRVTKAEKRERRRKRQEAA